MPYAFPADPSSSTSSPTATTTTNVRPGHRRTRSSFSDERGPGAFVSLGALPRRRPASPSKKAVFHLNDDDDSPQDDDHSPATSPPVTSAPLAATQSLRLSMETGRFSPSIAPPSHIDLPKANVTLTPASPLSSSPNASTSAVPFPQSSPLSPTDTRSPFIPSTPSYTYSASTPGTSSIPRTPSTPVILSNGRPLKSSLKGSSSSPNVAGDFTPNAIENHPIRKHFRVQSAPSTPRVHFAEKDAGLESVKVFNRSGKPANISRPPGDETETETEAENSTASYPFPSMMSSSSFGSSIGSLSLSGTSSPTQLIHEVDTTPGATSTIPNPCPAPAANVHVETVTLPRTRPPTLRGTVLVRNISFEKAVAVRFTLDEWQTTSEVSCKHVVSLPGLPPPFPRTKTMGDVAGSIALGGEDDGKPKWDRFSFTIRLEDYESKLSERTLFLVARYTPANGANGEFWDNNDGRNYRIGFRRVIGSGTGSPLATPRAVPLQASASLPTPFGSTTKSSSFSIPQVSTFGPSAIALKNSKVLWNLASSSNVAAQQKSFSAPSTLRFTPATGSRPSLGALAPTVLSKVDVSGVGAASDDEQEKAADDVLGSMRRSSPPPPAQEDNGEPSSNSPSPDPLRIPITRRHTSPYKAVSRTPHFPMPPPISIPHNSPGHSREGSDKSASPAQTYISRRLSLSNYVAPGSASSSPVSDKKKTEDEKHEARTGMATPPSTPPREARLRGLPDDEAKADAQAMLSPLVIGDNENPMFPHPDTAPFSPMNRSDKRPFTMSSLGAQLALTQLASPPVSRQSSAENSRENSGTPSPTASGRNSPRRASSPQPINIPESSTPLSPSAVTLPSTSPGGSKVDTSDSSYAAFVRQWCFAQSTPPTGTSPSGPSMNASPAVTPIPSPPSSGSFTPNPVGVGMMGMASYGSFGTGVTPRRQQAWPVDHQAGYHLPGFNFAGPAAQYGGLPGPQEGIVGGEFFNIHERLRGVVV